MQPAENRRRSSTLRTRRQWSWRNSALAFHVIARIEEEEGGGAPLRGHTPPGAGAARSPTGRPGLGRRRR
eukprot:2163827-Pyramimonas_sp.AAC.1